jgi:hypothetical protein
MRTTERLALAAVALLVAAFQLWTIRSTNEDLAFGQPQRDYYNLLIDGWLEGQLHLKVEVPAALQALDNPYDPALRPPGLGLHDASYYQGRYYLYFGVAPVVTLMLPFRVLTGLDLPLPVAVLVFVYGGFLASMGVWRGVRARYFADAGPGLTIVAGLVLGLANSGLLLLRRPDMWELPIAAGACFALLMLGCVWRSLQPGRRRGAWFAAAGLCLGLAIASRPTYLIASPCLLPPLVAWWRDHRRFPWRWAMAAAAPLAFIGALMAWHNFARFGDPLQFGQAYQFSLDYESKQPHFGLHYVPFNLRAHFLAFADWSRFFPFIAMADLGPTPRGYTVHRGDVYGLLANLPLTALALLAPLALWRRAAAERRALGAWFGTAALLCALAAGVMLSFFSALARYQVEFAPTFVLLALIGLLAVERWLTLAARPSWRFAGRLLWGAAAVATIVFGLLNSLQYDGLLQEQNPRLERTLARTLNRIPALGEWLAGREYGPVEFTLRLPPDNRPGDETLLTVGDPPRVDRVFIRVRTDGRCQFGVARAGMPELLGEPLTLETGAKRQVRVALGSLLPPAAHPYFAGWDEAALARAVRHVRIEVNGVPVLTGHGRFLATAAGRVRLGPRALGLPAAPRFRGELAAVRRVALRAAEYAAPAPLEGPGDTLRLRVRFPAGPAGTREPLVVTGAFGAADLLLVEYLPDGHLRFALDHWGSPLRASPPVPLRAGGTQEIEVTLGSLRTVPDATLAGVVPSGRVRVVVNGKVVWEEASQLFPAEAGEIYVGRNPVGGTSAGPVFTGELLEVTRVVRE